nr:unnamed protein product [Spirometra erinaceieuropaei]
MESTPFLATEEHQSGAIEDKDFVTSHLPDERFPGVAPSQGCRVSTPDPQDFPPCMRSIRVNYSRSGELTSAKIRELMEKAQQTIAKRKQDLGLSNVPATPYMVPQGLIADPERAEKARKAAELQAKIAAKLDTGILKTDPSPEEDIERKRKEQMRNLIFDEHGKTLDAVTGEEVRIPQFVPTLKANLRAQKAQNFKEALEVTTQKKPVKVSTSSSYFDPRLSLKSAMRPKRTLSFYEPGKFIKIGQRLRTKAQLEKLQESVALAAKRTGIASAAKLATIQPKRSIDETHVKEEKSLKTKLSTGGSRSAQCVKLKKKMDNHEAATRTPLGKELENPIENHNTMEHLEEVIDSVKQDCEVMTREDFLSAYLPSIARLSSESGSDPDSTRKMPPTSLGVEPLDVTDAVRSFNTTSSGEHLSTMFLSDVCAPDLDSGATKLDHLGTEKYRHQKRKLNSPKEASMQIEVASNTTEGLREAPSTEISASTSDIPGGVWVECVRCLKWRFLEGVKDPTELNEAWHCALQPKYSKNEDFGMACEEPETMGDLAETQYVYGEFATGSVVLAKMTGYPEWPSMVDCDTEGRFAEFCPKTGEVKSYRVVFLDPENRTTQLIPANRIRRMDLEARIESCLQGTKSRSAAQLYKNYVEPYRIRRKAATPRRPAKMGFHDRTEQVNRDIVGLFSLALKKLISASEKVRSTDVNDSFKKCAMEEKRRECERRKSLTIRRKKGYMTTCFHEGRRAARTVLTKEPAEKEKEVLATSENFRGPPGTWIECTHCKKWRFEPSVRDPSEVSENWRCFLQTKLAHLQPSPEIEEAACAEPEDPAARCHDQSYLFNEFTAGSIVLAKMQGFPWWPAMVDLDASGKYARIDPETHIATHYNVVFLDPCKSTTRLLPASSLRKFTQMDKADILRNAGKHLTKIAAAFIEAEEALKVSIVDRVSVFGYPHTKSTVVRDEHSLQEVDSPRMALSQVPMGWKFRRSRQKMRRSKASYCGSSLPHSCPANTLCYAQDVIQDIKQWTKRLENETVGATAVDIDDLITTVLYETEDWSSELMYRTFLPYSHCRFSHEHRTVNTPNKVAEEASTDPTASLILPKLETVMGNKGQQVDEGLGPPRGFPESDVLARPLDICSLDCISSPQHLPWTNEPVTQSTGTITRPAFSTPGPICLLSVLKAQATAKTGLIQAFGQFITNLPFHIQLSAIKPQSQNE